jgi:hypothetical protein
MPVAEQAGFLTAYGEHDVQIGVLCVTAALSAAGAALAPTARRSRFSPPVPIPAGFWIMPLALTICFQIRAADRGPVGMDKAHPYVPNNFGPQSTYRVADLNNPILQDC